ALRAGLGFTELHNGFASCCDPERLQAICGSFSPEHLQAFFDRWIWQIPTPLSAAHRAAGYWWELSMSQVEVSRTLVLDEPARAANQRLLIIEQAAQSCAIASALYERIHQPYNREGQRTGALRFGDTRAIALAGALCTVLTAVTGFTNKSLRPLVAGHLGPDY